MPREALAFARTTKSMSSTGCPIVGPDGNTMTKVHIEILYSKNSPHLGGPLDDQKHLFLKPSLLRESGALWHHTPLRDVHEANEIHEGQLDPLEDFFEELHLRETSCGYHMVIFFVVRSQNTKHPQKKKKKHSFRDSRYLCVPRSLS